MNSSCRSKSIVVNLTLMIALAVTGVGVFASTAGATGSTMQFNVLGNTNGTWGNNGGLASVTLMVDSIEYLHSLDPGSPFPWTVTTQAICNGAGFVPSGQQYDNAYSRLFWDSGGAYLDAWYQAKTVGGSCDKKGNAIFAFGTSAWASVWAPQYDTQRPGDSDIRGLACVFPNGFLFSWAACSTHLTTGNGNSDQHAQLTEAANLVKSWGWTLYGYPTIMSGDFNLTSVDPDILGWYYGYPFSWATEVDGNYPNPWGGPQTTCCWGNGYVNKIDYTWFARMTRQAGAVVAHTGYPYSDHEMLLGRITF